MNSYDMKGRVAVVTGGAQGIGLAVTRRLAEGGAIPVIWDLDGDLADREVKKMGLGSAHAVDVTDLKAVEAATKAVLRVHGRIDALINSAGIAGPIKPLHEYPPEDWHRIMAINVDGVFHCCRSVIPAMREARYGRIVNIASIAGKEGTPNASAYSTSKGAVIALTKALGKEHAEADIAVNCVTPAAARTRIFEQMTPEHIDYMLAKIPRGRFLELDEAASMIAWLASSENSFTTSSVFDLSGGRATY